MVPGDLPAGEYQTQWFFGGQMTLTLPDGWTSPEDSTGEFLVQPLADPDVSIAFWEDVYPVEPNTVKRIETVPITRAGLVDWLMANPNLEVSNPAPATIRRSSRDDRRPQGRR